MSLIRKILTGLAVFVVVLAAFIAWLLHGDRAQYNLNETTGPKPRLAEAAPQWFPTIGIAGCRRGFAGVALCRRAESSAHPDRARQW